MFSVHVYLYKRMSRIPKRTLKLRDVQQLPQCHLTSPLLYEQGPALMFINCCLVPHVLLSRKSPRMCGVNANFRVIQCHKEGTYSSFVAQGGDRCALFRITGMVFWRRWNWSWRQIVACFPPVCSVLSGQSQCVGIPERVLLSGPCTAQDSMMTFFWKCKRSKWTRVPVDMAEGARERDDMLSRRKFTAVEAIGT